MLVLQRRFAIARHAGVGFQIARRDRDRRLRRRQNLLHALPAEIRDLPLQIPHARFAGVEPNQLPQPGVGDFPFAIPQPMILGLLRNQVTFRNLDLFVFGVAGQTNDLHPIKQRLRHSQRIRRRDEHHVRQIVIDLEIMIGEGRVLLRIQHLEQGRRWIAPPIGAEFVDLVQQKEGIRGLRLLHRLDDLTRHRADIGSAVAADLRFVAHAAQRHPHEIAAGRLRDRLAERRLADARRPDKAENRTAHLLHAVLHREIFEDAILHLLKAVMIVVQHRFGGDDVAFHLRRLLPRNRQHPVEIVTHDGRFSRHRRHCLQLLQLSQRFFARFFGKLGLRDPVLEFLQLVATVFAFTQLLLNGLHLLIQIVFALRLLHLPFHTAADLLLNLKDADLRLHKAVDPLQPVVHRRAVEQLLLLRDLQRQMRRHRVGELGVVVDLIDRDQHLRRDLLVELDVLLELADDGARQRFDLALVHRLFFKRRGVGLEELRIVGVARNPRARAAFDENLHGAVGQLQQLQNGADRADLVDVGGFRVVVARILLRGEQDLFIVLHDVFERAHGFIAADEERNDHMGKNDDVPQREHRIKRGIGQKLGP